MGTASRKTWLEKQSDAIQIQVLSMDEEAWTLEQMRTALQEQHGILVPLSTLANSLKIYYDNQALRLAESWGDDLSKLIAENPQLEAAKLARGFLTQKMATAAFRSEPMKAEAAVNFSQRERRLDLEERRMKALERRNDLQKEKNDLERSRVEMQIAKFKQEVKDATEEVEKKIVGGGTVTPADVMQLKMRLFGKLEPATEASAT